jgi:hypothetical protein
MRRFSKTIAWLCLLLTLGSAAAVVLHHHEDHAESAQCMVCVAAHSTPPAIHFVLPLTAFVAISFIASARVAAAKQRLAVFALAVRPPPHL